MRNVSTSKRLALLLAIVIAPAAALGWGGSMHRVISKVAAFSVPEEMEGWNAYAPILSYHSIDPDLWKNGDPNEPPRHFIDLERYAEIPVMELPRDLAEVQGITHRKIKRDDGIVPWVVLELQNRLTQAMADGDWYEAASVAAAMGHYVGDLHQPLHTAENYDGAMTVNHGVHMRWELGLPDRYWRRGMVFPGEVEYLPDIWPAMLGWIEESHSHFEEILAADRAARHAAGGSVESARYFEALWDESGMLFRKQVSESKDHLASLWYTAWVDAGRPEIPEPPEGISRDTIWQKKHPGKGAGSGTPFFIAFGLLVLVIIGMSFWKQRKSVLGRRC